MTSWASCAKWLQTHSAEVQAISAAFIAIMTAIYVFVTCRLWSATKRSADAAKMAADAAKVSADIAAALHRPYLDVPVFTIQSRDRADRKEWLTHWRVKNFGALPASVVKLHVEFVLNGADRMEHCQLDTRGISPQQEIEGSADILINPSMRDRLNKGDWPFARVEVTYLAPGGGRYILTVKFTYDTGAGRFRPESSETKPDDG